MVEMLSMKRWALLGATQDRDKYGYKIFKSLEENGYTVYGVNPKYNSIDGIKIYNSLDELPCTLEAINMVVNPKISLDSLDKIKEKGIKNIWFQPGSFDERVIERAREMGFNIEYHNCLYAELNKEL